MARKRSEEGRIVRWFQEAPFTTAEAVYGIVRDLMSQRRSAEGPPKLRKKKEKSEEVVEGAA